MEQTLCGGREQQRERIGRMRGYLFGDLAVSFFDLDLLSGLEPNTRPDVGPPTTLPFFPLLSRGWALTEAYGVELPEAVADPANRIPSLWTTFTPDTYDLIRDAIATQEVR